MHLNQPIDMSACPKGSTPGIPSNKECAGRICWQSKRSAKSAVRVKWFVWTYVCLLETGIYSVFWNDILERERVNATSRKLHDPNQTRFECGSVTGSATEKVCRGQTWNHHRVRPTWSNSIWHIRLRADSPASTQCSLRPWSGVGCWTHSSEVSCH